MKTFDLTTNELLAATTIVKDCLSNMGGVRPIDLDSDPCTWTDLDVLLNAGWNRHEAAGTIGALMEKGILGGEIDRRGKQADLFLTDEAYRWLDTVWQD